MPRILHAADLHLSDNDRGYSLSVFQELIDVAHRERVDFFIFCGDLFNTFSDAEKLRSEFRKILGVPEFEFFFLPGNHEDLNRGSNQLPSFDWGAATVLTTKPFSFHRRECKGNVIEFLAIPHQENYSSYSNWNVTPKEKALRIGLAHGVVAGMSYRGPDEEEGGAALDPDLFQRFQVDYAALGHIHGRRTLKQNSTLMAYPGSCRVWRKNEMGARGAFLLDWNGGALAEPQFMSLGSAGQYYNYAIPLGLEGKAEAGVVEAFSQTWKSTDYIELTFSGLVEDERVVVDYEKILIDEFGKKVRKFEINREDVSALPGIASNPLVTEFLERWQRAKPLLTLTQTIEEKIWLKSREMGLNAIKNQLERRR